MFQVILNHTQYISIRSRYSIARITFHSRP